VCVRVCVWCVRAWCVCLCVSCVCAGQGGERTGGGLGEEDKGEEKYMRARAVPAE